jgi:hypothetical protein
VRGFGLSQVRLTLRDEIGDESSFFLTVNAVWDASAALLEIYKASDKASDKVPIGRVEMAP